MASSLGALWLHNGLGLLGGSSADPDLTALLASSTYLWADDGSGELVDTVAAENWTDLIAGEIAAQGTAGKRPTGKALANGKIVLTFTAASAQQLSMAGDFAAGALTEPYTVTLLASNTHSSSGASVAYCGGNDVSHRQAIFRGNGTRLIAGALQTSQPISTTAWVVATHVVTVLCNGASSEIWIDGASENTGNTGGQAMEHVRIGTRWDDTDWYWDGDIYCIRIKDGDDSANRATVEGQINRIYGEPVTLP